ncbi:MAG TPA: peptidylprolyl isomerase [Burkholderiales bacterium]|nr:peptidylprolyl isomerase [Burkholderiales bacterium]
MLAKTSKTLSHLVVGIVLSSVWAAVPAQQPDVIATMGAQQLRAADLKRLIDALPPDARKRLAGDLNALDRLVREELVRQSILTEAKQQGWDKKPDVQLMMDRAREQALLQAYVNNLARPAAGYPSEDEVKGYYEASKGSYTQPAEFELAQIFIASPADADKAVAANAQKKAVDVAARVQKAPADFAKIAKESSDHKESAARGGELGWVPETQLIPEVRAAVARMTKGEVSAPIRSDGGWHIVRLADRKVSVTRPLPEVRDQIVATMRLRKAQEVERRYIEDLLSKSAVSVNQADLQKLQAAIK